MHPLLDVLCRARTTAPELVQLIEARQLDLELESRAATLAARKRHKQAGLQPVVDGRLDLFADKLNTLLAVDRQQVVGKTRDIHLGHPSASTASSTPIGLKTILLLIISRYLTDLAAVTVGAVGPSQPDPFYFILCKPLSSL
jgi:hypothetical protein